MSDVTIYTYTPGVAPIEGIWVGLYDSVAFTRLQSGTTNSSGYITFSAVDHSLNSGVYELRVATALGGEVTGGTRRLITVVADPPTPPASNIFDITISVPTLATATDPNLCRCSGYFLRVSGAVQSALSPIVIKALEIPAAVYSTAYARTYGIVKDSIYLQTDSSGHVSVDLIRGGVYQIRAPGYVNPISVVIPDLPSANIVDLCVPTVASVKWFDAGTQITPATAPTLSVAVGGSKELTYTVWMRSGAEADVSEVTLASSDTDVMTISTDSSWTVTLTGVSAGTASIEITAVAGADSVVLYPEQSIVADLVVTVA